MRWLGGGVMGRRSGLVRKYTSEHTARGAAERLRPLPCHSPRRPPCTRCLLVHGRLPLGAHGVCRRVASGDGRSLRGRAARAAGSATPQPDSSPPPPPARIEGACIPSARRRALPAALMSARAPIFRSRIVLPERSHVSVPHRRCPGARRAGLRGRVAVPAVGDSAGCVVGPAEGSAGRACAARLVRGCDSERHPPRRRAAVLGAGRRAPQRRGVPRMGGAYRHLDCAAATARLTTMREALAAEPRRRSMCQHHLSALEYFRPQCESRSPEPGPSWRCATNPIRGHQPGPHSRPRRPCALSWRGVSRGARNSFVRTGPPLQA